MDLTHPEDKHVIISPTVIFIPLITSMYHCTMVLLTQIVTANGFYDEKDLPSKDKKTGETKLSSNQYGCCLKMYERRLQIMYFPIIPKCVRTNLKKHLQTETIQALCVEQLQCCNVGQIHNGVEHRVKECYERNKKLIDPIQQPEEIRTKVFAEILQAQTPNILIK